MHNGGEIVARHEVSADESGSEYGGDGMANGDGGSKRRRGGRPVAVDVDEQKFLDRCNESPTPTNKDLMSEFGLKRRRVQHLKNKLGCGQKQSDMQAQHTALFENITNESLQTRWVCEDEGGDVLHRMTVPLAVKTLAKELAVSVKGLRQRMKDVQFDPLQAYSLDQIKTMVRTILETHSSGQLGASFVEAKLRLEPFKVVVRMSLIREALKSVDQFNYARRRTTIKKTPAQYTVKGAGAQGAAAEKNSTDEQRAWTMDGINAVMYMILNGGIKINVMGEASTLRSLAQTGNKTRKNGEWAEIVRAEQAYQLMSHSGQLALDRTGLYEWWSRGQEVQFAPVRTLIVFNKTRKTPQYHNEVGWVVLFCRATRAKCVKDFSHNWGDTFVKARDTQGEVFSDKTLVVLSGAFQRVEHKNPGEKAFIAPSNPHCNGGPYVCTLKDVGRQLANCVLPVFGEPAQDVSPTPAKKSRQDPPASKK